jgi:pectinesterase
VAGGEGISPRGKVYLGRPWRPCAKACFVDCHIGDHISPEGWQDWDKPEARILSFFGERGSSGPGAPSADHPSRRVAWARHPEKAETDAMYREIVSFLE